MLRNKNPNTTSTNAVDNDPNAVYIDSTQISSSTHPVGALIDHRNNKITIKSNNENNNKVDYDVHAIVQQLHSPSSSSSSSKPTHRRGYSHGSYSSLNPTSNILLTNPSSSTYLGSLGRNTLNNSMEDRRNLLNAAIDQGSTSSGIMKCSSNDHVDANENNSSLQSLTQNEETKRAIQQIEQKRHKIKKAIAEEQFKCNENVNEYLKLAQNAQPSQGQRIKTVFEKKNQKSSQRIARYQKKMNRLDQELENIKNGGNYHRDTRERLRDVGTNIKEGISGLSGGVIEGIKSGIHTAGETVITRPKQFFKLSTAESNDKNSVEQDQSTNLLVFESDYQNHSGNSGMLNSNSHSHSHSTKCTSEDDSSSITSESGHLGVNSHSNSAQHSFSPVRMKPLKRYYTVADIDQLRNRIDERTQDCLRFSEDIDALKNQFQSECLILNQALQDEKYRLERLEEQLNDLTELHQKEIENLKQTISDLEEKIQYQTEERHRDVHEMLESFQARISRMEHQQHQHLQQLVNLDSLDNSNARALVLKLINVLLTVLQVILLLVATVANILAPFLQTRMRIFTSVFVIILFTFVFQHLPDFNMWTKQKIYENCAYVLSFFPFSSINSYYDET